MKAYIKALAVNGKQVLSFYSVSFYREVKMFEPMPGPRTLRLRTGITEGEGPRTQSMLRLW